MNEVIESLLFKLNVMGQAEYKTESLIEKTREDLQKEIDEMDVNDKVEMLESYGNLVEEYFEDGGRWSNYRTQVYRFYHNSEYIFVRVSSEVPATEMQDGGDFGDPEIEQVWPKKIETTIYTTEKGDD